MTETRYKCRPSFMTYTAGYMFLQSSFEFKFSGVSFAIYC